jgi:hypothetical protein
LPADYGPFGTKQNPVATESFAVQVPLVHW